MTNDEAKSKQEETLNNLKKYNKTRKTEVVDDIEGNPTVVTQWRDIEPTESFEAKARITKVRKPIPGLLDNEPAKQDFDANETTWTKEEIEAARLISLVEDDAEVVAEPIMSHLCPYCGTMAYMGQIHCMGYCKEKVQYEQ